MGLGSPLARFAREPPPHAFGDVVLRTTRGPRLSLRLCGAKSFAEGDLGRLTSEASEGSGAPSKRIPGRSLADRAGGCTSFSCTVDCIAGPRVRCVAGTCTACATIDCSDLADAGADAGPDAGDASPQADGAAE